MTDPAKPLLVREWDEHTPLKYEEILAEHNACVTEVRSRPTREELQSTKDALWQMGHERDDAQREVLCLKDKLAASEAALSDATEKAKMWHRQFVSSEAERERLVKILSHYGIHVGPASVGTLVALAGKDPTDGKV